MDQHWEIPARKGYGLGSTETGSAGRKDGSEARSQAPDTPKIAPSAVHITWLSAGPAVWDDFIYSGGCSSRLQAMNYPNKGCGQPAATVLIRDS